MSYYTLFKGWLLLSQPAGFLALLVHKRPLFFDSVTFPLVLKYVSSKDEDTLSAIAVGKIMLGSEFNTPPSIQ